MNTGTILDTHARETPRYFWQKTPPATALELAVSCLQETQRDQLDHKHKAEYHDAMHKMLVKREERLLADITRLSKSPLLQLQEQT